MFPVTADSGECLPRQTMRLCSSEPLPTPCLCVRIGNISPLPRGREQREREREREREKERDRHHPTCPKFIPVMPDPADRFLRSSRNAARSIRCASLVDYSSSESSPIVLRRETFGNWVRVPRVAPEQFADIGSYGYAFDFGTRNSYVQLMSIFPSLYAEYR